MLGGREAAGSSGTCEEKPEKLAERYPLWERFFLFIIWRRDMRRLPTPEKTVGISVAQAENEIFPTVRWRGSSKCWRPEMS